MGRADRVPRVPLVALFEHLPGPVPALPLSLGNAGAVLCPGKEGKEGKMQHTTYMYDGQKQSRYEGGRPRVIASSPEREREGTECNGRESVSPTA
jgi:hypothetical protein